LEEQILMNPLNVAIIGCGGHAQSHFRMIRDEPDMRLVAIAEIDPERLERARAEHQPPHAFLDYREMLDRCALDVVYVTTMPGHLLPIVLDCLERDLHVSVEKSPGMSAEETMRMAEAARRSKGKAIVSFNRRYIPEVLAVRRMVQERGGAVHCGATYNKPVTRIGTPAMTGIAPDPIICDAIHHVDLLRWLAGRSEGEAANPVEVYAEVADGDRPGAHRHNAVVRFDTGAIGAMMSHYGVGYRIQRADVHAEDFSAYLDLTAAPRCEIYTAQTGETDEHYAVKAGLYEQPLDLDAVGGPGFNETRHFVRCIREDRIPWSHLDDAVTTMRLCEAIRRGHKGPL
jgi:predicted dehydrogenase